MNPFYQRLAALLSGGMPQEAPDMPQMFRAPPREELDRYQTQLSPEDEAQYQADMGPRASDTLDYDMRGWWQAHRGQSVPGEGVHFEDTYKLPNHPTFSDQSKVHGVDGFTGGTWGEQGGQDTFEPSPTNRANMSYQDMLDYFREVEPSAKLKISAPNNTMALFARMFGR